MVAGQLRVTQRGEAVRPRARAHTLRCSRSAFERNPWANPARKGPGEPRASAPFQGNEKKMSPLPCGSSRWT